MTSAKDHSHRGHLFSLFSVLAAVLLVLYILPVVGLLGRAPWTRLADAFGDAGVVPALLLSLTVSASAAILSVLLGLPLAWVLARGTFAGRRLLRTLVVLPMVFPPVVGGIALFTAFGRYGILGPALDALGIRLAFTPAAAVMAATFVASPFFVLGAEAGLASVDRRLEEVAATLGAGPWRTFTTVTLPAAAPALLAGLALTWARALGEFGATIMFAGNMPGRTQTVPLAVYEMFNAGNDAGAILLSLILVAVSILLLLVLRGRVMRP